MSVDYSTLHVYISTLSHVDLLDYIALATSYVAIATYCNNTELLVST